MMININDIVDIGNVREFDKESIESLAKSIEAVGLIQPIIVTPHPDEDGKFIRVAGARRLEAIKSLGHAEIEADVRQINLDDLDFIQATENIEREDMDPITVGNFFAKKIKENSLSAKKIAKQYGFDHKYVLNTIKLATKLIAEYHPHITSGALSIEKALIIADMSERFQKDLIDSKDRNVFDISTLELERYCHRYGESLDNALFNPEYDFDKVGSCVGCKFNTRNMDKQLFDYDSDWNEVGTCTNQDCFDMKNQSIMDKVVDEWLKLANEKIENLATFGSTYKTFDQAVADQDDVENPEVIPFYSLNKNTYEVTTVTDYLNSREDYQNEISEGLATGTMILAKCTYDGSTWDNLEGQIVVLQERNNPIYTDRSIGEEESVTITFVDQDREVEIVPVVDDFLKFQAKMERRWEKRRNLVAKQTKEKVMKMLWQKIDLMPNVENAPIMHHPTYEMIVVEFRTDMIDMFKHVEFEWNTTGDSWLSGHEFFMLLNFSEEGLEHLLNLVCAWRSADLSRKDHRIDDQSDFYCCAMEYGIDPQMVFDEIMEKEWAEKRALEDQEVELAKNKWAYWIGHCIALSEMNYSLDAQEELSKTTLNRWKGLTFLQGELEELSIDDLLKISKALKVKVEADEKQDIVDAIVNFQYQVKFWTTDENTYTSLNSKYFGETKEVFLNKQDYERYAYYEPGL